MKKILVGILGIFMVLGGFLFSACGSSKVEIVLSETTKEIVVLDENNKEPVTVEAEVKGIENGKVSVSSSQQDIVTATVSYNPSSNKNIITLVAGETEGTATVVVTSLDKNVSKNLTVVVRGQVIGLEQNTDKDINGKYDSFAIRGGSVALDPEKLLNYTTTLNTSRKGVVWTLAEGEVGAELNGNVITLDEGFVGNKVTVIATSLYNQAAETEVVLDVIDKIDTSTLQMKYTYDEASGFTNDLANSKISLTSNIQAGGYKKALIEVSFQDNNLLEFVPVVRSKDGLDNNQITILANENSSQANKKYFTVEGKDNANLVVDAYFNIGYKDYNYSVASPQFEVSSYLAIEKIEISTDSSVVGDETLNIYTSYGNGAYGEKLDIQILPLGVLSQNADYYNIKVDFSVLGASGVDIAKQNTIQFFYIGLDGVLTPVSFTQQAGELVFVSENLSVEYAGEIYVKANHQIITDTVKNINITFTSVENPSVSKSIIVDLYKSADSLDFGDSDTAINFATNKTGKIQKTLVLQGQTGLEGLSIETDFEYVNISNLTLVPNADGEENSVTFTFDVEILISAVGKTEKGTYRIVHENGLVSEDFEINLYLPLTEGVIKYNPETANGAKTDLVEDGKLYVMQDGVPVKLDDSANGLSFIMMKKGMPVLLQTYTNLANGNYAKAEFSYQYLDLSNEDYQDEAKLEEFKNLSIEDILRRDLSDIGGVVSIRNNTMTALVEGVSWVVVRIYGVDENGQNVEYVRAFLVESYVAPSEWSLSRTDATVYASNSVSDTKQTKVEVRITFSGEKITYKSVENFKFTSQTLGAPTEIEYGENGIKLIKWNGGIFSITNVNIYDTYMTFEVNGLTTNGAQSVTDLLKISYQIGNDQNVLFELDSILNVNVLNADRIEEVKWLNYKEDGIYFELTDLVHEPIVLVTYTSPTNAKNKNLRYFVTNASGAQDSFISTTQIDGNGIVSLNAKTGKSGYLYIIPEDAINNNEINFYVEGANGQDVADKIRLDQIGMARTDFDGTNYDYLVANAYFKNNNQQKIYFEDILVRINVLVADGESFETAYRIYSNEQFEQINPNKYYTIMNNIETSKNFANFFGGLQGDNENITITLNGKNIIGTIENGAEIRNLTFSGNVYGQGFVADRNAGTITNVTIDVAIKREGESQSFVASELIGESSVGGVVGINEGTIDGASVLGLKISATESVGGIAGENFGTITNSAVEFYNFQNGANKFVGNSIGAIVGKAYGSSRIYRTYAYDYTLAQNGASVLDGTTLGAFVAESANVSEDSSVNIEESFSVVNVKDNAENLSIKNSYISYYDGEVYTSKFYGANGEEVSEESSLSDPFVKSGEENFLSYVNNGKAHLSTIYQDEALSEVDNVSIKDHVYNNLQQSLYVSSNKAILFYFDVKTVEELDESEQIDLDLYNTISLANLLSNISTSDQEKIVATSSNVNVVSVENSLVKVNGVGDCVLTIYSKQDYSKQKTINVKVLYSTSKLDASYAFAGGSIQIDETNNNAELPLQETKSIRVSYKFNQTSVYLGNSAKIYDLTQNAINVEFSTSPTQDHDDAVTLEWKKGELDINLTANVNDVDTYVYAVPKIEGLDGVYANVYQNAFDSSYVVKPFAGALELNITNNQVPITPSSAGYLEAVLTSTSGVEAIEPVISINQTTLKVGEIVPTDIDATEGTYSVVASMAGTNIFNINVSWTKAQVGDIYQYNFKIYFSVHEDYRNSVSQSQEFTVTLQTLSQIASKQFSLVLDRQSFNNIAVSNYKIVSTTDEFQSGSSSSVRTYSISGSTNSSTLAPGSASVMKVNVNPTYAYYDYLTIEYSGSTVASAVMMDFLKPQTYSDTNPVKFVRNNNARVEQLTNGLKVYPTSDDKDIGNLYFRIWINNAVNENSEISFTIKFFSNEEEVQTIKYYLSVSYLRDAEININGEGSDVVLAKGETAKVQIILDANQSVNLESVIVENSAGGINKSTPVLVESDDKTKLVYEFEISASVTASTTLDDNGNSQPLNIKVQTSKKENNVLQTKEIVGVIRLVDVRIDKNNIEIVGSQDDKFVTYVGIGKPLQINYHFLPEEYSYDASDAASVDAVKELNEIRKEIQGSLSYNGSNYQLNVGEDGKLKNRIEYYNTETGGWSSIYNKVSGEFAILNGILQVYESADGTLSFEGLRTTAEGEEVQLRMTTYETVDGTTREYEKYFTVGVETYSDEDLPICIYTEDEFLAIQNEGTAQNYILMNDLHLKNYTPFDTTMMDSFDGNGYVIHIDSFNVTPSNTSVLNLALFNNITANTTLKNVTVNIYDGGQILADISKYTTINVAGFAIRNAGTVTNCQVVAYNSSSSGSTSRQAGINVTYINGAGTSDPVLLPPNSKWTTTVSGFVNENEGSITNSRVGGDQVVNILEMSTEGLYKFEMKNLGTFYIIGQGDVSGFVGTNTGKIASSYSKNIDVSNQSDDKAKNTAGFVISNSGSIITSYVEGVQDDNSIEGDDDYCRMGSSLKSSKGVISGFVYNNNENGTITDCYSNILIANSNQDTTVYLASGFVYENSGALKNCYSASQVQNLKYSQMNFSGVDENGNLMTTAGSYENCYYYNSAYTNKYATSGATETDYNTGAGQLKSVNVASNFYGFAVSNNDSNNSVWKMTDEGIKLVEADLLTLSHRYYKVVDKDEQTGIETYTLPYSSLQDTSNGVIYNTEYGSYYNPILIRSAEEFVEVTGTSKSTNVKKYFDESTILGTYRLVADIDLTELLTSEDQQTFVLPSSSKRFTGVFYGNGFTISNLSITSGDNVLSYGLFSTIEKNDLEKNSLDTMVVNLNLTVSKVVNNNATAVGALAGYVRDAKLINIQVTFNDNSVVEGLNFVGGIAGFVFNDSELANLSVIDPKVVADKYEKSTNTQNKNIVDAASLIDLREYLSSALSGLSPVSTGTVGDTISKVRQELINYSYAGGIAGFVDIFKDNQKTENYTGEDYSNAISNQGFNVYGSRASGDVNVEGGVAGGLYGLTGGKTHVRDSILTISGTMTQNNSHIIATKYFAGGVIGQSFGSLSQIVATHSDETQELIDNNYNEYYSSKDTSVERGVIDLFSYNDVTEYSQKFVGGLVGYVGSGSLKVSYSNINVIGKNADYAGGVIGAIDTQSGLVLYTFTLGLNKVSTKYAIEEVYSTGDIRAKVAGGGIVGIILNANSNVSFTSVNSVNFLSIFNYDTNANYNNDQLGTNQGTTYQGKTSGTLKFYSLVGAFGENLEVVKDKLLTLNTKPVEEYTGEDEIEIEYVDKPSVGKFQKYSFGSNGQEIVLSTDYFPGSDAIYTGGNSATQNIEPVFDIEQPFSYTNASTGKTYTEAAFLKTDAWSTDNWIHYSGELYPKIRYADLQASVVYLDQWNVESVVKQMNENPDIEVMVRGLRSKDADVSNPSNYGDVYMGSNNQISDFAGTLFGDSNSDVQLILSEPLFTSTGAGLQLKDLKIVIQNVSEDIITAGFISKSQMIDTQIQNVKIDIYSPITLNAENGNVGFVAPSMQNVNIQNLSINDYTGTDSLLVIKNSSDNLNAGIIAGEITQASTISTMNISGVSISVDSRKSNENALINFDSSNSAQTENNSWNIGLYFGKADMYNTEKAYTNFTIAVSEIKHGVGYFTNTNSVAVINFASGIKYPTTLNVGGYIGYVGNITEVKSNFTNNSLNFGLSFKNGDMSSTNFNYGGMFGIIEATSVNLTTSNYNGVEIYNVLTGFSSAGLKSLNYGGLIGTTASTANISGIRTLNNINGSLRADQKTISLTDKNGDLEEDTENSVKVAENVNYGGLVGQADSLNISSFKGMKSSSSEEINLISFTSTNGNVNAGGIAGTVEGSFSLSGNGSIYDSFYVKSATANVAGVVGSVNGNASINGTSELIRYDGQILINASNASNASTINSAGMIGVSSSSSAQSGVSSTIKNTSFGGTIRVFGGTNLYLGGTIGDIQYSSNLVLQNNYNYGDVYLSNEIQKPELLYFGGIYGRATNSNFEKTTESHTIKDNYSLMTFNCGVISEDTEGVNIHALFGTDATKDGTSDTSIIDGENNFYNHGVALCSDSLGRDVGYYTSYNADSHLGYDNYYYSTDSSGAIDSSWSMIKKIVEKIGNNPLPEGHKLNPKTFSSSEEYPGEVSYPQNGVYYYVLSGDTKRNTNTRFSGKDLKNIAIIGDGYTLTTGEMEGSFIESMSGYSYISSLLLNTDVLVESASNNQTIAGLVGKMTNGNIYAVGVDGSVEVGGTEVATVAGLIASASNSTIRDSYSVANILYRAAGEGTVAGLIGSGKANIFNSFTGGTVTTYIDANMCAFSSGSHTIKNSYTYTTLDWNDHTSEKTSSECIISVFGDASISDNCYYDKTALNIVAKEKNNEATKGSVMDGIGFPQKVKDPESEEPQNNNPGWGKDETDNNNLINFGYPIRVNFKYLAPSSLYIRGIDSEDLVMGTKEYSYTRVTLNATLPLIKNSATKTSYAYGIPNGTILASQIAINVNSYDVLFMLNDIENLGSIGWDTSTLGVTEFDGNGHTIHNFGATMFGTLQNQTIRNLRLTNDNEKVLSESLLSTTLNGGNTISNMTLSGYMESCNGNVGALANTAQGNNTINAVTNLVNITVNVEKDSTVSSIVNVGGIIGQFDCSVSVGIGLEAELRINYCSNYGNIIVDNNEKGTRVGGLIGFVSSWEGILFDNEAKLYISHSYNAGSILGGYTSEVNASNYVGGLLGGTTLTDTKATINIENSYNSGIVKAGNKAVEDGNISYAGGIIGYGTNGEINNCYNEGSIEALGANPDYKFDYELKEETINYNFALGYYYSRYVEFANNDKIKNYSIESISIVQVSEPNVYAFGIGCLKEGTIDNVLNSENANVKNNGSQDLGKNKTLAKTSSINEKALTTMKMLLANDGGYAGILNPMLQEVMIMRFSEDSIDEIWGNSKWSAYRGDADKTSYSNYINFTNDNIIATSYDELGIPTSAAVRIPMSVLYRTEAMFNMGHNVMGFASDLISVDFVKETYTEQSSAGISKDGFVQYESEKTSDGSTISTIKQGTRSSTSPTEIAEVQINGESFYLADQNNLKQIFSAGSYMYEVTVEIQDAKGIDDVSCYSVTDATLAGSPVLTSITGATKGEDGTVKLTIKVVSTSNEGGDFTCNIDLNYAKSIVLNIQDLNYVYDELTGLNGYKYSGNLGFLDESYKIGGIGDYSRYKIAKFMEETIYNQYAEMAESQNKEIGEVLPGDDSSEYIFMIYDVNTGSLLYKQNATLYHGESSVTINTGDFIEAMSGNTFYNIATSSTEINSTIEFSDYKESEYLESTEGETTISNSISVGQLYEDIAYEIKSNFENIYSSTLDYIFVINQDSEIKNNFELIYNQEETFAEITFNEGSGLWETTILVENTNFLGYDCNITKVGNDIKFSFTNLAMNQEQLDEFLTQLDNLMYNNFKLRYSEGDQQGDYINIAELFTLSGNTEENINNLLIDINFETDKEFIIIDNEQNTIASRSANGQWFVNNQIEINIGGLIFSIKALDSGFELSYISNENLSLNNEDLENAVNNYISTLKFIGNKGENQVTIKDQFNDSLKITREDEDFVLEILMEISKNWSETSGNFELISNDDGGVTISIKEENITYVLGDVVVLYGEYDYNLVEFWQANSVQVSLSTLNQTDEDIKAGLTVDDEYKEGDVNADKELTINLSEIENDINIKVEKFAMTKLAQSNATSLNLVLSKEENEVYVKYNNENGWAFASASYLYVATNKDNQIAYNATLNVEIDENGDYSWKDANGNVVLKYSNEKYLTYYDSSYSYSEKSYDSLPDIVYTSGLEAESIFNGTTISTNELFNIEKLIENIKFGENEILYLTDSFVVLDKMSGADSLITSINQKSMEGITPITFDTYNPIQYTIEYPVTVTGGNSVIYEYNVSDKTIEIQYKKSTNNDTNVQFDLSYNPNKTEYSSSLDPQDTTTPQKIILMQDISLGVIDFTTKSEEISISGNNFYLSFYRYDGEGLYSSSEGQSFVKDVDLLAELQNSYLLPSGISYINISSYGIIDNLTNDTAILQGAINDIIFENNMSIVTKDGNDGANGTSTEESTAGVGYSFSVGSATSFTKLTNYGSIFTGKGGNGYNGTSLLSKGTNGTAGENGKDGGYLKIYAEEFSNKGILKTGIGGNGGAGGIGSTGENSVNGNAIFTVSTQNLTPGKGGAAGENGAQGTCTWSKQNKDEDNIATINTGEENYSAKGGGRSRYGFGGVGFQQWKDGKPVCIYTVKNEKIQYGDVAHSDGYFANMLKYFKYLFNYADKDGTNNYDVELPK